MHHKIQALHKLDRAVRLARMLPDADVHDNLDALRRAPYIWTESAGRHSKLFECGRQQLAIAFGKSLKDFFAVRGIQGSYQLWSDGKVFIDFFDNHNTKLYNQIDSIHRNFITEELA